MFQCLLTGQLKGYVPTWGKMVGKYGAKSEDSVKTFKDLSRKANNRSEAEDVGFQVRKEVQKTTVDDSDDAAKCFFFPNCRAYW